MGILEYVASSALYFINLHEMTSHWRKSDGVFQAQ